MVDRLAVSGLDKNLRQSNEDFLTRSAALDKEATSVLALAKEYRKACEYSDSKITAVLQSIQAAMKIADKLATSFGKQPPRSLALLGRASTTTLGQSVSAESFGTPAQMTAAGNGLDFFKSIGASIATTASKRRRVIDGISRPLRSDLVM